MPIQTAAVKSDLTKRFLEPLRASIVKAEEKKKPSVRVSISDLGLLLDLADPNAEQLDAMLSGILNRVLSVTTLSIASEEVESED